MISFDIFDTLITRKTMCPMGTFLMMQRRLEKEDCGTDMYFVNSFPGLRANAETTARSLAKKAGKEETTLDAIYEELQQIAGISRKSADMVKRLEIEAETDNLLPCMKAIRKLKKYHANGEKVILISDMYLNSDVLKDMLLAVDSIFKEIPIYVSCEYEATKVSGSLYRIVQKAERAECSKWIHYGDNKVSDVFIPRLMGIETHLCRISGMEEWEQGIADGCDVKYNLDLQIFLGTTKYVRQSKRLGMSARIGLSLGGMVLYPFIEWILRKCRELNIHRLYFIARDGYVIKAMSDKIIQNRGLDISTSYIYGSRIAWDMDALNNGEKELLKQYTSQEVDFSDDNFAFVDMQGTGKTFNGFCEILKDFAEGPFKIFYYDFMSGYQLNNCKAYPFFSDSTEYVMVENLCRAPHDVTVGYRESGGRVIPVLKSVDKEQWEKCGIKEFAKGAALFAEYMSESVAGMEEINAENRSLAAEAMNYITNNPCEAVMDHFAEIYHKAAADGEEAQYVYAPKLSYSDIWKTFLYRTDEDLELFYKGSDLEYSLKRMDPIKQKFFKWCRKENFRGVGNCVHKWKEFRKNNGKTKRRRLPKIILYGAGENGRKLFYKISLYDSKSIIAWVDIKKDYYCEKGYPVKTIDSIFSDKYDYLVLTMKNRKVREDLCDMLQQAGIKKSRILSAEEYSMNILGGEKQEG